MRADVLANGKRGERFIAGRRINKRRRRGYEKSEAIDARGATLFVLLGLGRVLAAIIRGRGRFHFCAAIHFLDLRNCSLSGQNGERHRNAEREAENQSQGGLHSGRSYRVAIFFQRRRSIPRSPFYSGVGKSVEAKREFA